MESMSSNTNLQWSVKARPTIQQVNNEASDFSNENAGRKFELTKSCMSQQLKTIKATFGIIKVLEMDEWKNTFFWRPFQYLRFI